MKKTFSLIALSLIIAFVCLPAIPALSQTPDGRILASATPQPDAYEPDEPDPPWIGTGESQNRNFYPQDDVDKARFRVKAGQWYEIRTYGLGPLVDTVLSVEVSGRIYKNDDAGDEELASAVLFQAPETADAFITITNAHEVYGAEQTYKLYAGETAPPTPTPTNTAPTPKPTQQQPPTATPGKPIVNFSATPDHIEKPGDCVMLRWSVDRASEVFLVLPNGNQEGVEGEGQRQVCPLESSTYTLRVNAPGGNETADVRVAVPLPTHTPTPTTTPDSEAGGSGTNPTSGKGKAPFHVAVFVDENGSGVYDPIEGVAGVEVLLMAQADPGRVRVQHTDPLGQAHFPDMKAGAYAVLIPHLGYAESITLRGEELTLPVLFPALRLPSRIP